ncbi:MAG: hypothetical protein E7637_08495 [Ruminococcaceae bacterium]|nr:hypothetical protein [Oscillospiraceae bacterium]
MSILKVCQGVAPLAESIALKDGGELILLRDSSVDQYRAVIAAVEAAGFSYDSDRKEGEVLFATYAKGSHVLLISYVPLDNATRVISEENTVIPPRESNPKQLCTPLMTQLKTPYLICDCGMSYLMRLCDGRFIVIDGGLGEYEETEYLLETMEKQNVLGGKPIIEAWFITHWHGDHYFVMCDMMERFGDRVEFRTLLVNTPLMYDFPNRVKAMMEAHPEIRLIVPHTGQRFVYADATLDVMYACEDHYPGEFRDSNDTSTIIRMELAGRRVLWLGDSSPLSSNIAADRFPKESLLCEFLQVGHHGYTGGSHRMYRAASPEYLLWPCPDYWYAMVKYWGSNHVLLSESPRCKGIFVAGHAETTFDMTKPVEAKDPWKFFADGETVYEQNFAGNRVLDLGWNFVTGGSHGYRAPKVVLNEGSATVTTAAENAYAVLQFIFRAQMDRMSSFTLNFSGKLTAGTEKFGLFYLYPLLKGYELSGEWRRNSFCEDDAMWFTPSSEDGSFAYCIKFDADTRSAVVYENGAEIATYKYRKEEGSALYFLLRNGEVTFDHIKLVKGV